MLFVTYLFQLCRQSKVSGNLILFTGELCINFVPLVIRLHPKLWDPVGFCQLAVCLWNGGICLVLVWKTASIAISMCTRDFLLPYHTEWKGRWFHCRYREGVFCCKLIVPKVSMDLGWKKGPHYQLRIWFFLLFMGGFSRCIGFEIQLATLPYTPPQVSLVVLVWQ